MARYGISVSKAGVNTATTIHANLWAPTNMLRVFELGISVTTAPTTAPDFYVVRSTARGTQTTTAAGTAMDATVAATSTGTLDSAWSAGATVGAATTAVRRIGIPVTAGSGVIWSFGPTGLLIANGAGLAVVNAAASGATLGALAIYYDWEE